MSATYQDFRNRSASKKTIVGTVTVPDFGEVHIGKMSAADRDRVQRALIRDDESTFYRARVVIGAACNEDGSKMFTKEDEGWLSELDADLLEPICNKAEALRKAVTEKN